MTEKLNTITIALEDPALAKLCKFVGVDPRGMTSTERNEAIKLALGSMAGYTTRTNGERRTIRRKKDQLARLKAKEESIANELDELFGEGASAQQAPRAQAPRAPQAPRAAAPAPTQAPAQAQTPPRAPRATAPQPIARRMAQPVPTEETEELPPVDDFASFGKDLTPSNMPPASNPMLASDDDDEELEKAELWDEALTLIKTIQVSGNGQKIAKLKAKMKDLDIRPETISIDRLNGLKRAMGGTA